MLSYMQSISETLHAGWHLAYTGPPYAPAPTAKMSYGVRWNPEPSTTCIASFNTMHPQERLLLGIVKKASKRVQLFAELKADPANKTDFQAGYKCLFSEGQMTGILTGNWKAIAIYKKSIGEMFQLTFTGTQDFKSAKAPIQFGVSMSVGGG